MIFKAKQETWIFDEVTTAVKIYAFICCQLRIAGTK